MKLAFKYFYRYDDDAECYGPFETESEVIEHMRNQAKKVAEYRPFEIVRTHQWLPSDDSDGI